MIKSRVECIEDLAVIMRDFNCMIDAWSEGDGSVRSFQDPFPSNYVKIILDTQWAFLQFCGQMEGEGGFHITLVL